MREMENSIIKLSNADITAIITMLQNTTYGGMGNAVIDLLYELMEYRKKENNTYVQGFTDGCEYILNSKDGEL